MTPQGLKKHAALVKAWLDGAKIEFFHVRNQRWQLCETYPDFYEELNYRIKPDTDFATSAAEAVALRHQLALKDEEIHRLRGQCEDYTKKLREARDEIYQLGNTCANFNAKLGEARNELARIKSEEAHVKLAAIKKLLT